MRVRRAPLPRRNRMRVGPRATADGSRLCLETTERHIVALLAATRSPGVAYQFAVDVAAIREHELRSPAFVAIRAIVADDHDPSRARTRRAPAGSDEPY